KHTYKKKRQNYKCIAASLLFLYYAANNCLILIRFCRKYTTGMATTIIINSLIPLVIHRNMKVPSKRKNTFNIEAMINILKENTTELININVSLFLITRANNIVIHSEIIVKLNQKIQSTFLGNK